MLSSSSELPLASNTASNTRSNTANNTVASLNKSSNKNLTDEQVQHLISCLLMTLDDDARILYFDTIANFSAFTHNQVGI